VHEIGRVNRLAVLSRDKTDVSRGEGSNDRERRMGDGCLERMTSKVGHVKPTSCNGVVPDTEDLKCDTL